jgi:hypothetical protein
MAITPGAVASATDTFLSSTAISRHAAELHRPFHSEPRRLWGVVIPFSLN